MIEKAAESITKVSKGNMKDVSIGVGEDKVNETYGYNNNKVHDRMFS